MFLTWYPKCRPLVLVTLFIPFNCFIHEMLFGYFLKRQRLFNWKETLALNPDFWITWSHATDSRVGKIVCYCFHFLPKDLLLYCFKQEMVIIESDIKHFRKIWLEVHNTWPIQNHQDLSLEWPSYGFVIVVSFEVMTSWKSIHADQLTKKSVSQLSCMAHCYQIGKNLTVSENTLEIRCKYKLTFNYKTLV